MRESVKLVFKGLMLERLLSRAAKRGVAFDSVKRVKPREAVITTDARGADELMNMAREYSLDIKRVSSKGPGALARKVKSRWTFLLALILTGCVTVSALSRVWIVDINATGGERVEIAEALERMGVNLGARLSAEDINAIQSGLSALCPSYAYIGVKARGVRLAIEAVEAFPAPDVYDGGQTGDIVSTADAVVWSVDVLRGTPAVTKGQSVKKGDALILGTERNTRDSVRAVKASGSVIGRVWLSGEARGELTKSVSELTGRESTGCEIRLCDMSRVISEPRAFDEYEQVEKTLPVGGIIAPVYVVKTTRRETKTATVARDMDAVRAETLERALENAMEKAPEGAEVFDKWSDFTLSGKDEIVCRALVEIRMEIGTNTNIDGG